MPRPVSPHLQHAYVLCLLVSYILTPYHRDGGVSNVSLTSSFYVTFGSMNAEVEKPPGWSASDDVSFKGRAISPT